MINRNTQEKIFEFNNFMRSTNLFRVFDFDYKSKEMLFKIFNVKDDTDKNELLVSVEYSIKSFEDYKPYSNNDYEKDCVIFAIKELKKIYKSL